MFLFQFHSETDAGTHRIQFNEHVMCIRHRFAINNQKDLQTISNTKSKKSSAYLKYSVVLNYVRIFVISLCYVYVYVCIY
jgi:hypothetical protein